MELETVLIPQRVELQGEFHVNLEAGKKLKINMTGNDGQLLDEKCPTGKRWEAYIVVRITETDS